MKGLLIKDLCLMRMQKRFFIVLVAISVMMYFVGEDTSFVMGYLAILMPMFSLSTISYDEFDNGNAFLFTLPITITGYVIEKYCFSAILGVMSLILGMLVSLCVGAFGGGVQLLSLLAILPPIFAVMLVVLAIMLPLQLKFGAEKARIAMIAAFGVVFVLGMGVSKLAPSLGEGIIKFIEDMSKTNLPLLIACAVLALIFVLAVSVAVSIRIMNKKEF